MYCSRNVIVDKVKNVHNQSLAPPKRLGMNGMILGSMSIAKLWIMKNNPEPGNEVMVCGLG